MKYRLLILPVLILALLFSASCDRTERTDETEPETETPASVSGDDPDAPVRIGFSKNPGFYGEEFRLEISASRGTIYYTTDGSVPDEDSNVYGGPLLISDASENDNVWSMRDDISTAYLKDLCVSLSGWEPGYQLPDTKIDKCTTVRAVAIDHETGEKSEVITGSYFVGFENKTGYDGIGIISLMTHPDNLFDSKKGIYVRGETFDKYMADRENGVSLWFDPYWWWWPCNYNRKGSIEYERPATVQVFDRERRLILSKDIGIRIQGGGSRGKVPRSFNLYAREEYDGTTKLGFRPFSTGYNPQRVTLFAGGDQNVSKLNDWLMAELMPNRNFSTMEFTPYALFLEGEYWGVYFMTEKYDEEYLHYHYGVKKDDVIMIKNGGVEEGNPDDVYLYNEMVNWISDNDMTDPLNYRRACEMIDINSYIDYYAAEIYIGRYNDWPGGNFACWRTKSTEKIGQYDDGKWRWMLFDVNSGAMEKGHTATETVTDVINANRMFRHLMRNTTFRHNFAVRILNMAENEFKPEHVNEVLDSFISMMEKPMAKEFERFYGSENNMNGEWADQVGKVRYFFENRYPYIVDYFKKVANEKA